MIRNLYSLLILVLLSWATTVIAQSPMLKGKVTSSEKPPPQNWADVRIKVMNLANNQEIEGEQQITTDQNWYHIALLGARVDIWFDKVCYVPAGLFNKYVKPGDNNVGPVRLHKTKSCLKLERNQTASPSRHHSAGRPFEIRAFTKAKAQGNFDQIPSTKTVNEELAEEARLARQSRFFDTFQYNFRVKWIVYSEIPALNQVLLKFRDDKQNQDLFSQLGNVPPEAFDDVIRAQFKLSPANFDNIRRVVVDQAMSPSVRGSATVAFMNIKSELPKETVDQMIEYYRQEARNSSSEILATSLVVLARAGDSSDKATIFKDIRSSTDQKRVLASMKAVKLAQIIEGPDSLPGGAQTLAEVAKTSEDSTVRAAAFSALRPFAYTFNKTAISALATGAKQDPDPEVRFRATVVLGVGDLEDDPWVRNVLRVVAKTDPSPSVRRAAKFSLSGARWFTQSFAR